MCSGTRVKYAITVDVNNGLRGQKHYQCINSSQNMVCTKHKVIRTQHIIICFQKLIASK